MRFDVCGMADSQGKQRVDNFVHLNTIKVNSGGQLTVKGIYLLPKKDVTTIEMTKTDSRHDNRLYNLSGQEITHPMKGLYIRNGRKVIVR